ncbi:MAG: chemotaxis-specific protein-glutamate methyltransferase CheB [Microcoleaceae cyanobacterium]
MPIRVFLVEDSPVVLIILKRILGSTPETEVVGSARTGREALTLIPVAQPDVICTDFHMPQMNGLEFIQAIMATYPKPILVISSSVQTNDHHNIFQLLNAGAIDIFPKPQGAQLSEYDQLAPELIHKVKVLAGVKVFSRQKRTPALGTATGTTGRNSPLNNPLPMGKSTSASLPKHSPLNPPLPPQPSQLIGSPTQPLVSPTLSRTIKILAVGASTGGPQALHTLFSQLPLNFPIPVLCVQHISHGFMPGLVSWLNHQCPLQVKIAQNGESPHPGTIYFAPEAHHLTLGPSGQLVYTVSPPLGGHRPSITITFESMTQCYGKNCAAVLLTGMGRDGADGLFAVAQTGGFTIAQDEATSIVFGMPKAAIALGAAQQILPLTKIAPALLNLLARAR